MPTFQEQQVQDLEKVFFNAAAFEFVTIHEISDVGGIKTPSANLNVVVDHELYEERRLTSKAENLSANGLVFFVQKSLWLKKIKGTPPIGSTLRFDGKLYQINDIKDNMDVLEFTLEANRGRG